MYNLGLLICFMLDCTIYQFLYSDLEETDLKNLLLEIKTFNKLPWDLYELLKGLLHPNSCERLSSEQAVMMLNEEDEILEEGIDINDFQDLRFQEEYFSKEIMDIVSHFFFKEENMY